ncbi:Uroporphyrinogen-III synthase [Pseudomonas sp. OF001]|uniref:uroporphyrinogen-III synthase n=1 Tax=Pseudomonas sp. OF001 TaxID=2772300 RepID=UPI001919C3E5|nr:uroporphyrinogen-III synthase [Pseudomonas sp. OF001]CAD5375820.1 Uroporphyrinogen-III synthase [Pseudomonas sp. OF001]
MSDWRLLLTRPAEDCAALAQTLAGHGVFGHCLPLLEIEALPETPEQRAVFLDLDRYCAVLAVSKPAARLGLALLDRYWPQPPMRQRWFAVGAATGALLDAYGLDACWPEAGDDSEALLALPALHEALAVPDPRLLILRGEGGRDWLGERLREQGVAVDYLCLYRRRLPAHPAGALAGAVREHALNGLVVSSGEGLANLQVLAGADWPALARLPLFVPSPRVATLARAAGALDVRDCRGASAAALLACLADEPRAGKC